MRLLLAVLIALVCLHYTRFYQGTGWRWLFVLFWIPITLNLALAGLGLVYRLDRLPFRRLDFGVAEDQVPPGGSFRLGVKIESRRATHVAELSASIVCEQRKVADGKRVTRTLHSSEVAILRDMDFEQDDVEEREILMEVPPDAPYSFRSMESKIVWTLRLKADVTDWGQIDEPIDVVVGPA